MDYRSKSWLIKVVPWHKKRIRRVKLALSNSVDIACFAAFCATVLPVRPRRAPLWKKAETAKRGKRRLRRLPHDSLGIVSTWKRPADEGHGSVSGVDPGLGNDPAWETIVPNFERSYDSISRNMSDSTRLSVTGQK